MPRGLDETYPATTLRVGLWLMLLLIIFAAGAGAAYYVLRYTTTGGQVEQAVYQYIDGHYPAWVKNGRTYKPEPVVQETAPPPPREAPKPAPPPPAPPQPAPVRRAAKPIKRASMIYLVNEEFGQARSSERLYTLPIWTYIPCVLETVLNSEIPGFFTVKTTRPVFDASGQHLLIPQGQRIGAKADTADLLFGQERIPTFSLSLALPDGTPLDLGQAPIMDASGTNGLTGDVDSKWWQAVWTSVFRSGLQSSQQIIQLNAGQTEAGIIGSNLAREGAMVSQQRLGRAQDLRPVITAHAGESCQILITSAKQLPAVRSVYSERR